MVKEKQKLLDPVYKNFAVIKSPDDWEQFKRKINEYHRLENQKHY